MALDLLSMGESNFQLVNDIERIWRHGPQAERENLVNGIARYVSKLGTSRFRTRNCVRCSGSLKRRAPLNFTSGFAMRADDAKKNGVRSSRAIFRWRGACCRRWN